MGTAAKTPVKINCQGVTTPPCGTWKTAGQTEVKIRKKMTILGFAWAVLALAGRKDLGDFERPEHAPRSPAGTHTCAVAYRRTPRVPAAESARNASLPEDKIFVFWKKIPFNTYSYKVLLRDVVYLKFQGCRKLKRGSTGVPILRTRYIYKSLLVQHRIRLCITTPPVIKFGALNNLSPGVLSSGGVICNIPRW